MDETEPINLRCSVLFLRGTAVLLCRRTDEDDTWVLPGGTPRRGEGTVAAARREVAEETGLQVAPERRARDDELGRRPSPDRDRVRRCRAGSRRTADATGEGPRTAVPPPRRPGSHRTSSTHRRLRPGLRSLTATRRRPASVHGPLPGQRVAPPGDPPRASARCRPSRPATPSGLIVTIQVPPGAQARSSDSDTCAPKAR